MRVMLRGRASFADYSSQQFDRKELGMLAVEIFVSAKTVAAMKIADVGQLHAQTLWSIIPAEGGLCFHCFLTAGQFVRLLGVRRPGAALFDLALSRQSGARPPHSKVAHVQTSRSFRRLDNNRSEARLSRSRPAKRSKALVCRASVESNSRFGAAIAVS